MHSKTTTKTNDYEKSISNVVHEELPTHSIDDSYNDDVRCNVRIAIGH